jgi:hypothetical protein
VAVRRDTTGPGVLWDGGIGDGDRFVYGSVPEAPACTATDDTSGPRDCTVGGYSDQVGAHTLTATATDQAGNVTTSARAYTVDPWVIGGFYAPVDGGGIVNVVKAGATVPLKFEVTAGGVELTDVADVRGLSAARVTCDAGAPVDEVEVTASGGTALRYDATAGTFVFNWKTPLTPGSCYRTTVTTQDGSTTSALFRLR